MKTRVTELLGIEKPVLLAAMTYVCNAELAAAVSNAGGLGMLGMNCAVEMPERDPKKNGENLRNEIKKLRSLTDKPYSVNYLPEFGEMDPENSFTLPYKKIIIEEKVPVVVISGYIGVGSTKQDITDFKKAGVKVIFREVDCTVETCKEAVEAGADAIIVAGIDGGGHVSRYNMSLLSILPQITDAITEVPIIAGGGIVNTKGAKAAMAMGADGTYIGTAFLVAEECRTHEVFKNAVIEAKGEDILMWRASAERMMSTANNRGRTCFAMAQGGAEPFDIGRHYNGFFNTAMIAGDIDNGIVSLCSAVGAINKVRPAKEILDDIAKGFE